MYKKLRVLQFPIVAAKGGITQYVLNLWKYVNREIIQFDFLTFSSELDFEEELINEGCKVYHISCYPETDIERFAMEYSTVLSHGYDVIELHTSYWKSTIMEEMAKEQGGCKVIIHAHSTGIVGNLSYFEKINAKERHNKIRNMLNETIADKFWACSKEAAEWLYGDKIPKEKIEIIKNTIDTSLFKYREDIRRQKRQEFNLTDNYVIGHVGRLEEEKNHNFILEIFAKLHTKQPQSILLLVGDGYYRKFIEERIIELKISDCVYLVGKTDNVSDYLHVMDVFVFPSLFEGFGLSLLEAQCSGLRCIGSTNVPKTAFVTKTAERVSLDEPDKWNHILEETAKGYDRKSQALLLREKGYDTITQIRKLEKMYME